MNALSAAPFEGRVPAAAVGYCQQLWQTHGFVLTLTRPRRSRLGTHQFDPRRGHLVTVNVDLNPAQFLITYLHEVAHVLTSQQSRRVAPHGPHWQKNFGTLLQPVLSEAVFPLSVLEPLRLYALKPTAATGSYAPLARALQALSTPNTDHLAVGQLAEGQVFELGKRMFVRGPMRRTRVLCTEQATGRHYTIPALAQVKVR